MCSALCLIIKNKCKNCAKTFLKHSFHAVVEKHTSVQHFPKTLFFTAAWQSTCFRYAVYFSSRTNFLWVIYTCAVEKQSPEPHILAETPGHRDESSQYRMLFTTAHQSREGQTDWTSPNRVERKSSFEPPRLPRARDGAGEQPVLIYGSLTSRYLLDCRAKWNTSSLKPS